MYDKEIRVRFNSDEMIPNHVLKEALIIARKKEDNAILYGKKYKMILHVGKRVKSVEIKVIPLEDREKETFIKRIINFLKP